MLSSVILVLINDMREGQILIAFLLFITIFLIR